MLRNEMSASSISSITSAWQADEKCTLCDQYDQSICRNFTANRTNYTKLHDTKNKLRMVQNRETTECGGALKNDHNYNETTKLILTIEAASSYLPLPTPNQSWLTKLVCSIAAGMPSMWFLHSTELCGMAICSCARERASMDRNINY